MSEQARRCLIQIGKGTPLGKFQEPGKPPMFSSHACSLQESVSVCTRSWLLAHAWAHCCSLCALCLLAYSFAVCACLCVLLQYSHRMCALKE